MTDFLVEKIAYEILKNEAGNFTHSPKPWAEIPSDVQEVWRGYAREFIANVFCDPEVREQMFDAISDPVFDAHVESEYIRGVDVSLKPVLDGLTAVFGPVKETT